MIIRDYTVYNADLFPPSPSLHPSTVYLLMFPSESRLDILKK